MPPIGGEIGHQDELTALPFSGSSWQTCSHCWRWLSRWRELPEANVPAPFTVPPGRGDALSEIILKLVVKMGKWQPAYGFAFSGNV